MVVNCLFSQTCVRIWDSLFYEGPKILFRVAVALLQICERSILRLDNAGEVLRGLFFTNTVRSESHIMCFVSLMDIVRQVLCIFISRPQVSTSLLSYLLIGVKDIVKGIHHRDKLMKISFEGIGGLPMNTIKRYVRHW